MYGHDLRFHNGCWTIWYPCTRKAIRIAIMLCILCKQCTICTRESMVIKDPSRISHMGLLQGLPGSHCLQKCIQVQHTMGTMYVSTDPVQVPEPVSRAITCISWTFLEAVLLLCRTVTWNHTALQETYRSCMVAAQGISKDVPSSTEVHN